MELLNELVYCDESIIETRLAVPVSFLVDEHIRQLYELDLIVTVVDTKHENVENDPQ